MQIDATFSTSSRNIIITEPKNIPIKGEDDKSPGVAIKWNPGYGWGGKPLLLGTLFWEFEVLLLGAVVSGMEMGTWGTDAGVVCLNNAATISSFEWLLMWPLNKWGAIRPRQTGHWLFMASILIQVPESRWESALPHASIWSRFSL